MSLDQFASITKFMAGLTNTGKTIKVIGKLSGFVKDIAKKAGPVAIASAAVPDIMDFMSGLTEPFQDVGDAMTDLGLTASEGFQEMADDITNAIYDLQPVAEEMGVWIGDLYNDVQAKDWDSLSTNVTSGLDKAWTGIVDFFDNDELMTDIGEGAAAIFNGIFEWLHGVSQDDWNTIFDGISTALTTFFDEVDWGLVFYSIGEAFYNLGAVLLQNFFDGLQSVAEQYDEGDEFWTNFVDALGGFGGTG